MSEAEDTGEAISVIPEELRLFVCDRVRSVEGLEVLRRMASPPQRAWSASELAEDLYLSEDSVDEAIDGLAESGLLGRAFAGPTQTANLREGSSREETAREEKASEGSQFVYLPASHRFDEIVSQLLEVYHEHPSAVVQCLTTRAMSRVRNSLIRLTERLLERAKF